VANERRVLRPNADQRETMPGSCAELGVDTKKEGVDGAARSPREKTKAVREEEVCRRRVLAKSR